MIKPWNERSEGKCDYRRHNDSNILTVVVAAVSTKMPAYCCDSCNISVSPQVVELGYTAPELDNVDRNLDRLHWREQVCGSSRILPHRSSSMSCYWPLEDRAIALPSCGS